MDTKYHSLYKNISIALVYLMSSMFIDNHVIAPLGLPISVGRGLLFINLGFIALYSYRGMVLDNFQRKTSIILLIIAFYLFIIWVVIYGINLTGPSTRNPLKTLITGLFFFVILNDPKFNMNRLCNTVLYIGFVFALLSLYLYFGYQFGFVQLKTISLYGYGGGTKLLGGIGGYLDPSYTRYLTRSQSYWPESAKFAQFLQFPLFFALQKFLNRRSILNATLIFIISIALLITFSVANFFGFLIAIILFNLINKTSIKYGTKSQKLIVRRIILFILFSIVFVEFYQITNQEDYKSDVMIGKNTNQSIVGRIERFNIVLDEVKENPFGSISFKQKFTSNPSAFGTMLFLGGFPLLFLSIILLWVFYRNLIFKLRNSVNGLIIVGSIAFCIANFWYGNFIGIYFIFNLALFSTILKYDKLGYKLL